MPQKIYSLSDLELDEVSFCTQGANELAKVVLFKRLQPAGESAATKSEQEKPSMSLVTKCAEAIESGNLGNLNKEHFVQALDDLAKSYAADHNLGFHQAYAEILEMPLGSELYRGHEAAPPAPARVQKAEPDDRPEAWKDITFEAAKIQRENPQLSSAQAIAKVLREQPDLYDQYEAECGRR